MTDAQQSTYSQKEKYEGKAEFSQFKYYIRLKNTRAGQGQTQQHNNSLKRILDYNDRIHI